MRYDLAIFDMDGTILDTLGDLRDSLNAALAQWLIGAGLAPSRYVASQGTALGRAGRVHVQQDGPQIWVGGHSVTCVRGEVRL